MKKKIRKCLQATIFSLLLVFLLTNCDKTPTLTTKKITEITLTTAMSGGDISNDGGATVTERGVCWSTNPNPTIADNKTVDGSGVGSFTSTISDLKTNTTYYVRAYATNSKGTAYGNEISFVTLEDIVFNPNINYGTMTDIDGNVYKTVTIGTQTWMAENLKTTKYKDGISIPKISDDIKWISLTTGAYCDYENDQNKVATYGRLYNWYAVNTDKLCPTGWHVSTDPEWTQLINYLGGELIAGGKLKEVGITHWNSPNTGATNESGFTALPSAYRGNDGKFYSLGYYGCWWNATEFDTDSAWYRYMNYDYGNVVRNYYSKEDGFSVRCVRD